MGCQLLTNSRLVDLFTKLATLTALLQAANLLNLTTLNHPLTQLLRKLYTGGSVYEKVVFNNDGFGIQHCQLQPKKNRTT